MALQTHEGEIPEEYLAQFEKTMQETTDGEVTKEWKEYAKGYVPYDAKKDVTYEDLKHKTGWFTSQDDLGKQTVSGTWQTMSRSQGKQKAAQDRINSLKQACMMGDKNACLLIQANAPMFVPGQTEAKQKVGQMSMYQRKGFAEGGLLDDSSRLWKMESDYPEFQKGVASKVTKERVPTQPIEEEFMYSPLNQGYTQGYAEGGSVYDETGSMLAPEVPLNFEDNMPMEEESELGLTADETEVLSQAMSDYPELQGILDKVSMATQFTGEGSVNGAGSETSDSINAKLSDGEFVFTAKAVKQLGVDKLRKMMAKAESDYDEDISKQEYKQMDEEGFAKGGFFTRPNYKNANYKDGGSVSTQDIGSSNRLGTIIQNAVMKNKTELRQPYQEMDVGGSEEDQRLLEEYIAREKAKKAQEAIRRAEYERELSGDNTMTTAPEETRTPLPRNEGMR